ncbi:MAG: hypothetical protein WCE65_06135 [Methanoregula sp.]
MITRHLGIFEGFGTNSPGIKKVFVDAKGRLWFSTLNNIGYYTGDVSSAPLIPVEIMTPTPMSTPDLVNISQTLMSEGNSQQGKSSVLDSIFNFFTGIIPFLQPSH